MPHSRPRRRARHATTALVLTLGVVGGLAACTGDPPTTDAPSTAAPTESAGTVPLAPGVPTIVTPAELVTYATARGLVYWAGEVPDHHIELTAGSAATYVRYLPEDTMAGSDEPALTVATYPDVDGYTALQQLDGDATTTVAASGALIYTPESAPASVYFAFPGSTFQVEVYSPTEGQALELTNDGSVRPVVPQEQS